ncbi:hypothetical protein ACTG2V_00020 [Aeromonas sp. 74A]
MPPSAAGTASFVIADPCPRATGVCPQVLLVNDLKVKTEQLVSWLAPGGYLLDPQRPCAIRHL